MMTQEVDSMGYTQLGGADTLSMDTLPADADSVGAGYSAVLSSHTLDSLRNITVVDDHINAYDAAFADTADGKGFFSTILTPFTAQPLRQRLDNNDTASSVLILCVFVIFFLIVGSWNGFHQQAKDFFMPPRQHFDQLSLDTEREGYVHVLMHLVLCIACGVLVTYYVEATLPGGQMLASVAGTIGVFVGCFIAYFGLRHLLYRFTNWVFFDRVKNFNWNESSLFLISLQTMTFLPLALLAVYSGFSLRFMSLAAVFLLVFVKFLLLYRTNSIFFGKLHCILHFIAYLCTLELLPMLALYEVLRLAANEMIIK